MTESRRILLFLFAAIISCGGCAARTRHETVGPVCVPQADKAELMRAAEDVLLRMHFVIDKADVEQGIIRTKPLAGAQFFEFWRSDNVGADNALLSNLHSVARIAELDMSRQEDRYCLRCTVKVYKLCLAGSQATSAGAIYETSSRSISGVRRLKLGPEQGKQMTWAEWGNDRELALGILKRVGERLEAAGKE